MRKLIAWLLPVALTGCSTTPISYYEHTQPKLELMSFFEGKTQAWGQFQGRDGQVKRRFTVDINGIVDDSTNSKQLTLEESFVYDDGETQERIWTIVQTGTNQFEGTAADVIGVAKGETAGAALNWHYTLALPYQDSTIEVQFDDWMFLQDERTMINRAEVTKFGFKVGEVILFFRKTEK